MFTRETYSNAGGAEMQAATSVEHEGNNYIMTFADGYQIGLSSPTDTTMQWLSMESRRHVRLHAAQLRASSRAASA